ncbi:MAG TPA: alpha/beta fold hydrolase [Acidimicrobiales bacterium]|nr:alpha/beta fold hydrolase [Acidimicrobiales bacterium]
MTVPVEAYVLIHGAHHGAWVWDPLVPHLALPALAVDLPGRGDPAKLRTLTISGCVEAVIAEIEGAGLRRVAVVGHSLAGSIAWTVAAQAPDLVVGLVGIAAVFPPAGKDTTDLWPTGLRWVPRVRLALRPGGTHAPLTLSDRNARRRLANDLDDDQTSWLLAHLGPESAGLTISRVPQLQLAPNLRREYVLCRADMALATVRQRAQAECIRAPIVEMPTGHDPMVSAPQLLARVLDDMTSSWSHDGL